MGIELPEKIKDYRQEARNIRVDARELHHAEARAELLLLAMLYDKLADLKSILVPSVHAEISEISPIEDRSSAPP